MAGFASAPANVKILVIAPSWIGDTVAAQPLFMRLHERHSGLALDVMAPPWVAPVLRRMPQVRRVLENPFPHGRLDLAGRWRLGRSLRAAGYDEAIVLPNSWKSALVAAFAGIPRRTGFTGEGRYGLLNNRHALDEAALPQIAQRYAALADEPGKRTLQPLPQPRLAASPAQQQATLAALQRDTDHAPIAFCPGAEYGPAKRWPAGHFAELARALRDRGHAVWLIGSAKDAAVAGEIVAGAAGACRNLCGMTSLDQAIDLLATARFVVSNDSGLMHVTAALDRPMLALFGSSSPRFTPPLSDRAETLWLQLDCSPCFKRQCPLGHFRCMLDIRPAQVLARIDARLAVADPPSA
jgi:heptosyltransferase-2